MRYIRIPFACSSFLLLLHSRGSQPSISQHLPVPGSFRKWQGAAVREASLRSTFFNLNCSSTFAEVKQDDKVTEKEGLWKDPTIDHHHKCQSEGQCKQEPGISRIFNFLMSLLLHTRQLIN